MIAKEPESLLADVAAEYGRARGLAKSSRLAIAYKINSFKRYLGRPPLLSDLNRDAVNLWLEHEIEIGLDLETIAGRRSTICTLWDDAYDQGLIDSKPDRIRKVRFPEKPPVCWDIATELAKLLTVCAELKGRMKRDWRIARGDYWSAYCRVGYDLGIRFGDLRRLRFDQISPQGTVVLVQGKTRHMLSARLSAESLRLAERLRLHGRKFVFGDVVNEKNTQRYFRKLVKLAGIPGSTKWLRKTGATWCENQLPGSAPDYLGHKSRGLAYRNYVDPRFVKRDRPSPPALPPML